MAKKPSNAGTPWTPPQQRQLKKLADENTPTPVIGLKLGRTPSDVSNQASKQGVSPQTDESVALRHFKEEVTP